MSRRRRINDDNDDQEEEEFEERDRRVRPRRLELGSGDEQDEQDEQEDEEATEPDTDEERLPASAGRATGAALRLRGSTEAFLAAVTTPGGGGGGGDGDGDDWPDDPFMRRMQERGMLTRMPFGCYKGQSLKVVWESEDGKDYIMNFMGRKPAFYHRANTLRNQDYYIRLLDSLHCLGYVKEIADIYGRTVRADQVLRAYQRDRLNTLESCGPVPKPLPERTPIRHAPPPAPAPAPSDDSSIDSSSGSSVGGGAAAPPPPPPPPRGVGGGAGVLATPSQTARLPPRAPPQRPARRGYLRGG